LGPDEGVEVILAETLRRVLKKTLRRVVDMALKRAWSGY